MIDKGTKVRYVGPASHLRGKIGTVIGVLWLKDKVRVDFHDHRKRISIVDMQYLEAET